MEVLNSFEIVVNIFLQSLGEWLQAPMKFITALGYEEFFVLLLPTIYWCFDQLMGLRVGLVLLIGNTFNTFFKFLFHNPRPYWISDHVQAFTHETSFGIPSGHAQTAAGVWGWLAVEVKKRWFTILALILVFLIGVSRLYLGVHFLSDVILGWVLGGLLVWAFSAWYVRIGNRYSQSSFGVKLGLSAVSTVVMIGLILGARWIAGPWENVWVERAGEIDPFNLEGAFTLGGTWFGMLSGFIVLTEARGHFMAGKGGWRRLVRLPVGLLGVVLIWFGLGQVFIDSANLISFTLRFFRYTFVGLWVSWLAPLVFEKITLLNFEDDQIAP